MSVAIVGLGLISPFADTPAEHVFFLRAGVPAPPASPFARKDTGERLDVRHCRWLGAGMALDHRLQRIGDRLLADARRSTASLHTAADTDVFLCTSKQRPGLAEDATRPLAASASQHGATRRCFGDAGAFAGLREAAALVDGCASRVAVVIAVDSFVSIEALDELVEHPPSEWNLEPPPPSEGGAAVALMLAHEARRDGIPILGTFEGAAVAVGRSTDENDEPVDGSAMQAVLYDLRSRELARAVFGPAKVDLLRQNEWHLAQARMGAARFAEGCSLTCFESRVGRLGAASGLANFVYGLATLRHRADATGEAFRAPFYAWAISPDGTRGAALAWGREL